MTSKDIEILLEIATTTGGIAMAPMEFGIINSSKKYGLEATRKKFKKSKGKPVVDSNSFSINEYDTSVSVQTAIKAAMEYKSAGESIDNIIMKLLKVYDTSIVKQAIKEVQ